MLNNKKGFSLLEILITALLLGILLKLMVAPYMQASSPAKQDQPQHISTPSQAKQTVDHVRATLKQVEKTAQQRATPNF